MSENHQASGAIEISPPIPWDLVKDDPYTDAEYSDVMLRVVDGAADAIIPSIEDRFTADAVIYDVSYLAGKYGEGRTFTGFIQVETAEPDWDNPDHMPSRVYVLPDRSAVEEWSVLTWPEMPEAGNA